MTITNELLKEQNQLLAERNQLLAEQNQFLHSQLNVSKDISSLLEEILKTLQK